jgi:uncharacterized protein (DUF4415 family)
MNVCVGSERRGQGIVFAASTRLHPRVYSFICMYGGMLVFMKRRTRITKGRRVGAAKRHRDRMAEIAEMYKPIKKPVTLRLDADVLAWFKKAGRGYQTRINEALRSVMMRKGN